MVVTPDGPKRLAGAAAEFPTSLLLVSDPSQAFASALCGGLGHCLALVDPKGGVRWARWTETWERTERAASLFQAAYRLARP